MKIPCQGSFAFLVCLWLLLSTNEVQSRQKMPCDIDSKKLLRTNRGKPLWLSSSQMIEKIVECVPTGFPPMGKGLRIESIVIIEVFVDAEGTVQCAQAIKGHPLLRPGVVEAVSHWKFQSVLVNGKAVAFLGHLRFVLSSSGKDRDVNPCLRFKSVRKD